MASNIAVAWLLEKDWKRWQELDDQMPDYPRWLAKIESAIKQAEQAGATPVKVEVDPNTFVAWCNANGKTVGRESRAHYAAQILMNKLTAH